MTTVTGDMAVFMNVLGHRQGDSRILEAIALAGPDMEVEKFDFEGERSTYFIFKPTGTDLLFENDILVSIMVRTRPDSQDPSYGQYPRPSALVTGLSPETPRAGVTALLGDPERVGPTFDRYEVNNRYLHVEYDADNRISRISALLEPV